MVAMMVAMMMTMTMTMMMMMMMMMMMIDDEHVYWQPLFGRNPSQGFRGKIICPSHFGCHLLGQLCLRLVRLYNIATSVALTEAQKTFL